MRKAYRDRYCAAGNHSVIRPRAFPAIDASLAACHFVFPYLFPSYVYRHALDLLRYTLAKIQFSRFFYEKKADALLFRNMIAPLYIKQNEGTAEETERSFSSFHDKRKDCTAFYFSMSPFLFSFFSFLFPRTKFAISRHRNVL